MQIYRFWECRRENICGTEAYFKAGSNESPEHAAQLLKDKIDIFRRFNDPGVPDPPPKEVAELRCRLAGNKDYSVPICEEFVEQIDARNIVTRNRSGALVLNSEDHAFFDIDFDCLPPAGLWHKLQVILGKRPAQTPEERLFDIIRSQLNDSFPYTPARLYRTAKGFRLLLNISHDADSPETANIMRMFHCDRLYAELCSRQKCFRARLTPKPRRIGVTGASKFRFPYAEETVPAHKLWVEQYEKKSADFAVCRLVKSFGPEFRSPVIEYHDRMCNCSSPLPLA